MTLFWTSAAGLIVLAMAFIIVPFLLKRERTTVSSDELNLSVFNQQLEELDSDLAAGNLDQTQYDAARRDLEKELLVDVSGDHPQSVATSSHSGSWIMSLALVIPLLALLLYQSLGDPKIIKQLAANPAASGSREAAHPQTQSTQGLPPMEELVKKLAAKMQQQPENLDGWIMLGRSYMSLKQPREALAAFERAMQLNDENPSLLLAYAEALSQTSGNSFTGKAAPLVEKAYQLNPQNPNALWMRGILAYQRQQYQPAIEYWEQLRDILGPQSREMASVDNAITDARNQLGLPPELPSIVQTTDNTVKTPPAADTEQQGTSSIQVKISLAPEMQAKAKPDDLVFIYARALSGPPMPLAAARKKVSDLPLTLTLDDSMAMMPQLKLSSFPQVAVGARISLSGNPIAQAGDLEGEIRPVTPGQADPVLVSIDSIHP